MYNDLKKENIIIEINNLVEDVEKTFEEIDMYCDFMKNLFLSGSGKN